MTDDEIKEISEELRKWMLQPIIERPWYEVYERLLSCGVDKAEAQNGGISTWLSNEGICIADLIEDQDKRIAELERALDQHNECMAGAYKCGFNAGYKEGMEDMR